MDTGTNTERGAGRTFTKGFFLASAIVSVLAGCSTGSSSPKSAAAAAPGGNSPLRTPASPQPGMPTPSATRAASPRTHVPVAPGSPANGPAIKLPAYLDAAPVGAAPEWRPAGGGIEIAGGAAGFAARFDPAAVRFTLHAGSTVPGGSGWAGGNAASTAGLVAGWNGGFLMANGDSWGGFNLDGRTAFGPLRTNTASEVFYQDGTMDVLAWPGGEPGPEVVGVRQNLALLVSDGKLASNLARGTAADEHTWGFTNDSSNVHANRSGVGVAADGRVIYAAVRGASPLQLAQFLQRAGAVRAMELDINMIRPIFGTYAGGHWTQPAPWLGAASQITDGNKRDFVAVYAR
jgi:hypothetical protein